MDSQRLGSLLFHAGAKPRPQGYVDPGSRASRSAGMTTAYDAKQARPQLALRTARPSRCVTTSPTCITSAYLWCMSNRLTLCDKELRSKQHSSTSTTWKPCE